MRRTEFFASLFAFAALQHTVDLLVRVALAALSLVLISTVVLPSSAQSLTKPGVVWQPPEDYRLAAADLRKIDATGFQAVRTGLIHDARILELADQMGIEVYQELPLHYLPASGLLDTLDFAMDVLANAVRESRRFPSAAAFGVARYVDTSDSTACAAIERLIEYGRRVAGPGTRFYYSTIFTDEDRCASAADFVLIDARDHPAPATLLQRWSDAHGSLAGLAGVGSWVRTDAPPGLRNSRSADQQARFLEERLTELFLDRIGPRPEVVFLYRWRDAEIRLPLLARADRDPYRATYGLHAKGLEERPAYSVVRGILTGTQVTFAFPRGEVTVREWPWVVIMGWLSLFLLGMVYAFSPRLRQMVPRYFRAHGFFRDAIREGRDLLLGTSLLMLVALGLAAGVTLAGGIEILGELMAFRMLLSWLPEGSVLFLARATVEPWLFALLIGAIYAGLILGWIILMMLLSRTRFALGPGQVLMLVIWPRWPLMLLMLAALALAGSGDSLSTLYQVYGVAIIAGLWVLVTLHAAVRAVIDFTAIARVPGYVPVILLLLNPAVIASMIGVFTWLQYREELTFVVRALLYA